MQLGWVDYSRQERETIKELLKVLGESSSLDELGVGIVRDTVPFLVEIDGNTEFYSISLTTYCRRATPDNVKTCICVAHDDEKEAHYALQMVVEDNIVVNQDKVEFWHHGAITVGKYGRGKPDDLRMFVEDRYPQIISGNKFFLGSIINNRLWRLDDPEVINVIVNMISYSIVRDEYREFVKRNKESEGK